VEFKYELDLNSKWSAFFSFFGRHRTRKKKSVGAMQYNITLYSGQEFRDDRAGDRYFFQVFLLSIIYFNNKYKY